jgi:hypothetical protein
MRGRQYEIDSYGMRDRSWGQLRTETVVAAPPFTWMTGTFPGLQMSWNLAAFDDPTRDPDWLGLFDVQPDEVIHDGWLFCDGALSRFKPGTFFDSAKHQSPADLRTCINISRRKLLTANLWNL